MQAWEWALELRTETGEWWNSDMGRRFGAHWTATKLNPQATFPANIANVEWLKLGIAAPFYVTHEMCDLLAHAQATFPTTPLRVEDLPTPAGFVLLAKPMWVEDIHGEMLPWQAFTWGLATGGDDPSESVGIHLGIYAHKDNDPDRERMGQPWRWPTLSLTHETAWRFDEDYSKTDWAPGTLANQDIEISDSAKESGMEMLRTIHTFLILSWQKIAAPTNTMASRPVRKRAMKHTPDLPIPDVRVVQLRRTREPREHDEHLDGGREYTHRWMVNAFWRKQWYPSEGRHKPKWIAPHVRGPADKPLVLKDTAYVWRR